MLITGAIPLDMIGRLVYTYLSGMWEWGFLNEHR